MSGGGLKAPRCDIYTGRSDYMNEQQVNNRERFFSPPIGFAEALYIIFYIFTVHSGVLLYFLVAETPLSIANINIASLLSQLKKAFKCVHSDRPKAAG